MADLEPGSGALTPAALDAVHRAVAEGVDQVVDGADVRAVLQGLLDRFATYDRDTIIGYFRRRIEELNQEFARRRAEEERKRAAGVDIDGVRFNMVAAVLLMATGTYERIDEVVRLQPELGGRLAGLGCDLLGRDVKPDMQMVARLQQIYAAAVQQQREREEQERKSK